MPAQSFFAWHVEDADLYSVNFLHWGAPKVWYCVPPSGKARFERVAAGMHPEAHRACKGFLRHKDILISPSVLKQFNVSYHMVRDRARLLRFAVPCGVRRPWIVHRWEQRCRVVAHVDTCCTIVLGSLRSSRLVAGWQGSQLGQSGLHDATCHHSERCAPVATPPARACAVQAEQGRVRRAQRGGVPQRLQLRLQHRGGRQLCHA